MLRSAAITREARGMLARDSPHVGAGDAGVVQVAAVERGGCWLRDPATQARGGCWVLNNRTAAQRGGCWMCNMPAGGERGMLV